MYEQNEMKASFKTFQSEDCLNCVHEEYCRSELLVERKLCVRKSIVQCGIHGEIIEFRIYSATSC